MSIVHATRPAVQLDAPADDWGSRFDAAQARFRASRRKPLVLSPDPLPMLASPIDGTGDVQDPDFYRTFQRTPELVARRLAVVDRHLPEISAQLDARDDSDVPADDDWDDETTWSTTEDAPAPRFTDEELLRGVPMFPHETTNRTADHFQLDRAFEAGFALGSSGFSIRDVAAPDHMTADETTHFMAGIEAGENWLWDDYARDMFGPMADDIADLHDREYDEARMLRPAVA